MPNVALDLKKRQTNSFYVVLQQCGCYDRGPAVFRPRLPYGALLLPPTVGRPPRVARLYHTSTLILHEASKLILYHQIRF